MRRSPQRGTTFAIVPIVINERTTMNTLNSARQDVTRTLVVTARVAVYNGTTGGSSMTREMTLAAASTYVERVNASRAAGLTSDVCLLVPVMMVADLPGPTPEDLIVNTRGVPFLRDDEQQDPEAEALVRDFLLSTTR
jgi:hypothetical protein